MAARHRTITVDGTEFISMAALAARVGKSKRTLQRMEREGRLAKPEHLIRKPGLLGGGSERFYTPKEVEHVVTVLAAEQQRNEVATTRLVERRPTRPWLSERHTETDANRVRQWSGIEDPASESTPEPEPLTSEPCPHCGGKDIVWSHSGIRGAHPSLNQYAFCEGCQRQVVPEATFDPPAQRGFWGDSYSIAAAIPVCGIRRRPRPLTSVQAAVRAPKPAPTRRLNILPPLD
jgi:hypothetical protein